MSIQEQPKQRALVLQGGGALGAYEAGVFNVLYHWIRKDCKEDENIFDVIAGTSIGAINAAIISSYTIKKRKKNPHISIKESWDGVTKELLRFWKETSFISFIDIVPFYKEIWNFWHDLNQNSLDSFLYMTNHFQYINPYLLVPLNNLFKYLKDNYDLPATGEAARRFYSVKEIFLTGSRNVFLPSSPILDTKFYYNGILPSNNIWYKYNNHWLQNTLEKYVNFPISTSFYLEDDEKETEINKQVIKQPRLLVTAVDIEAGATVSFDSYEYPSKECKICSKNDIGNKKIKHYDHLKNHIENHFSDYPNYEIEDKDNNKNITRQLRWSVYEDHDDDGTTAIKEKHVIFYNNGIEAEHIMASASIPIHYDHQRINSYKFGLDGKILKQERHFWDGQLLSNTPLRELISEHKKYWQDKIGYEVLSKAIPNIDDNQEDKKDKTDSEKGYSGAYKQVPDLEVYMANIWPTKENEIPKDHDLTKDRRNDIANHDKTIYDEKTSKLVTDYIDLCKKLIDIIDDDDNNNSNNTKIDKVRYLLEYDHAVSTFREGEKRYYKDLLIGRFAIHKVVRIERRDDSDAISEKWADYSQTTIYNLIKDGIRDTVYTLLSEIANLVKKELKDESKETFFNILIDQKYNESEKRYLLYNKFDRELSLGQSDNQEINKSIDALIEGTKIYHEIER